MNIDWLWLGVGIAFAWFVLPMLFQMIGGGSRQSG